VLQIELLDANSGSLIWGETYNRSQDELAGLQEEVARELAYRLRMRLKSDVSDRLQRQYRTNSAAYDAYLKGHCGRSTTRILPIGDTPGFSDYDCGPARPTAWELERE
jgi:hypothetical protein